MDVQTAFLNSVLTATIYVSLPTGFEQDGCRFARLRKSLYGLKQAARDWYALSHSSLLKFDARLRRSTIDPCMYYLIDLNNALVSFISVHVDDYIFVTSHPSYYDQFLVFMKKSFKVSDLGKLKFAMGVAVEYASNSIRLSQRREIRDLVAKFGLVNSRRVATPMEIRPGGDEAGVMNGNLPDVPYRSLIGSLAWIARNTRPDILFAVNYYARFNNCYTTTIYNNLKRVLRYLHSTDSVVLTFIRPLNFPDTLKSCLSSPLEIVIYSDSDWAGDPSTRRSVSGGVLFLHGNALTFLSVLQRTVALSSSEAELMGLVENMKDGLHILHLIKEIFPVSTPVCTRYDNIGAAHMAANPVNNKRSKHIDIRYKWLHELVDDGTFSLEYVQSDLNLADLFTKSQPSTTAIPKIEAIMNSKVVLDVQVEPMNKKD
jgi:hypothetical protein